MLTSDAIRDRRSIRRFTDRTIKREEIETLLDAAIVAPNHKLTQPWRFYVLGPEARHAFGLVLGGRKAKKIEDPTAAQAMRDNVAAEHRALPTMIVVTVLETNNPEVSEEDYAATMMAVQNIALAATAIGLGTHIKSGAVMSDPAARDLASSLRPAVERAIGSGHPLVVVTDGELDDPDAARQLPAGSRVILVKHPVRRDLARYVER